MEIRGCGGIGRPTGSGWETEERFLGVEAFVMEGNGQVLVLKEGLVLKGYFSPLFCHIDLVAKTLTTCMYQLMRKVLSRLISASVFLWSFLGSTHAGTIAYYRFDETSGLTASDSARGAAGLGTLGGFGSNGAWEAGKSGNALRFNGSSTYVRAPLAIDDTTQTFTMAAWVKASSRSSWGTIVKNWGDNLGGAFHFGLDGSSGLVSNYVGWHIGTTPVMSPSALPLNEWVHVAVTFNGAAGGGRQRLFINGTKVDEEVIPGTAGGSLPILGSSMFIGVKGNDSGSGPSNVPTYRGYWDGWIDELIFFVDEEKDATTIGQIYTAGTQGTGLTSFIPEPTSGSLVAAGLLGWLACRRRKTS